MYRYDEDYNHEPCQRSGHRAHWAAASGETHSAEACFTEAFSKVGFIVKGTSATDTTVKTRNSLMKLVYETESSTDLISLQ